MAVKAALVRGRKNLLENSAEGATVTAPTRAELDRYASLFNARNWDALRDMVSEDCRLDLVSRSQRHGKQVREYFTRYEKEPLTLRVLSLEGTPAIGVYPPGLAEEKPAYFIQLVFEAGKVVSIRDFRYVPYIANEADYA